MSYKVSDYIKSDLTRYFGKCDFKTLLLGLLI